MLVLLVPSLDLRILCAESLTAQQHRPVVKLPLESECLPKTGSDVAAGWKSSVVGGDELI